MGHCRAAQQQQQQHINHHTFDACIISYWLKTDFLPERLPFPEGPWVVAVTSLPVPASWARLRLRGRLISLRRATMTITLGHLRMCEGTNGRSCRDAKLLAPNEQVAIALHRCIQPLRLQDVNTDKLLTPISHACRRCMRPRPKQATVAAWSSPTVILGFRAEVSQLTIHACSCMPALT